MIFSKKWRINRIRVKLAGAEAALKNEVFVSKSTGTVYPMVMEKLTREVGELSEKLRQLLPEQ